MTSSFVFITAMNSCPWGGSEELWSRTALRLAEADYGVSASVPWWQWLHPMLEEIEKAGVSLFPRRTTLWTRLSHFLSRRLRNEIWLEPQLESRLRSASLVIISQGANHDGIAFMQYCLNRNIPYVSIVQANCEHWWPDDSVSEKWAQLYRNARAVYCVSDANKIMLEMQIGESLPTAKVVRNPFNVPYENHSVWPSTENGYKLACVGRLDPASKGQDILFQVLSKDKWKQRPLSVSLYGNGPSSKSLSRLATNWRLHNVHFAGYEADIKEVWKHHHALILPSRYEGLPLAIVEAMLSSRMVITTAVAGNNEVVKDSISGFIARAASVDELDDALERAWLARSNWKEIGETASTNIRQLIPSDPVGEFTALIKDLADKSYQKCLSHGA